MNEIIEYIITFLLYGNTEAAKRVGYTKDETLWGNYSLVIIPTNWKLHFPDLNVKIQAEQVGSTLIIREDIIYNTFFLISRAEELLTSSRDVHNRFCAKFSIMGRRNQILMPIVDEYSDLLIKLLDLPHVESGFSQINLTHDVDTIAYYRHLRGCLGGIYRRKSQQVIRAIKHIETDPAYTFPWLLEQDELLENRLVNTSVNKIFFLKQGPNKGNDYPQYGTRDENILVDLLRQHHCVLGYHSSYKSGSDVNEIVQSNDLHISSTIHRSHYLRCSIEKMQALIDAGFTDDYSMQFPDMAGFRLGTSRAVKWINPISMTLSNLTLHPLTIMDCTLNRADYMNLSEEEAYYYCMQLIDKTRQHHGELTLLWHNTSINDTEYHKSLYTEIIKTLCNNL